MTLFIILTHTVRVKSIQFNSIVAETIIIFIYFYSYSLSWSNGKGTLFIGGTTNILALAQTIRYRSGQPGPIGRCETGTFATGNASQEIGIFARALGILFGLGFLTWNLGSLTRFVGRQLFCCSHRSRCGPSQETHAGKTEGRTQKISSIHDSLLQFSTIR